MFFSGTRFLLIFAAIPGADHLREGNEVFCKRRLPSNPSSEKRQHNGDFANFEIRKIDECEANDLYLVQRRARDLDLGTNQLAAGVRKCGERSGRRQCCRNHISGTGTDEVGGDVAR